MVCMVHKVIRNDPLPFGIDLERRLYCHVVTRCEQFLTASYYLHAKSFTTCTWLCLKLLNFLHFFPSGIEGGGSALFIQQGAI